ncbi:MAG: 3-ketoacyl-ACP reductase [Oscillospiraceae bacterium]|jgi:NAD(P)-dependent dehydrogenase (short-subunit alcohol dehydrogenase family)|nr:3-ketoacyl-ACP reductase [Oscillospiraceae bacterium]
MNDTRQRVAVVTGSTRGIGRGIADALWDDGYIVIYSGSGAVRPGDLPDDRPYQPCDVSEAEQRDALVRYILTQYNRLDVFVSNAGVAPLTRLDALDTTPESYDRVMNVNLRGAFFLAQRAAKAMLALRKTPPSDYSPRMIFITSISAYAVSTNRAEYCISKAGLSMAAQIFAARLASEGIPVFEIRPGVIATDMTLGVKSKYESMIADGLTPIPRMGEPADVARMVQAACSGLLDFTTGQILNADGGYHVRRL